MGIKAAIALSKKEAAERAAALQSATTQESIVDKIMGFGGDLATAAGDVAGMAGTMAYEGLNATTGGLGGFTVRNNLALINILRGQSTEEAFKNAEASLKEMTGAHPVAKGVAQVAGPVAGMVLGGGPLGAAIKGAVTKAPPAIRTVADPAIKFLGSRGSAPGAARVAGGGVLGSAEAVGTGLGNLDIETPGQIAQTGGLGALFGAGGTAIGGAVGNLMDWVAKRRGAAPGAVMPPREQQLGAADTMSNLFDEGRLPTQTGSNLTPENLLEAAKGSPPGRTVAELEIGGRQPLAPVSTALTKQQPEVAQYTKRLVDLSTDRINNEAGRAFNVLESSMGTPVAASVHAARANASKLNIGNAYENALDAAVDVRFDGAKLIADIRGSFKPTMLTSEVKAFNRAKSEIQSIMRTGDGSITARDMLRIKKSFDEPLFKTDAHGNFTMPPEVRKQLMDAKEVINEQLKINVPGLREASKNFSDIATMERNMRLGSEMFSKPGVTPDEFRTFYRSLDGAGKADFSSGVMSGLNDSLEKGGVAAYLKKAGKGASIRNKLAAIVGDDGVDDFIKNVSTFADEQAFAKKTLSAVESRVASYVSSPKPSGAMSTLLDAFVAMGTPGRGKGVGAAAQSGAIKRIFADDQIAGKQTLAKFLESDPQMLPKTLMDLMAEAAKTTRTGNLLSGFGEGGAAAALQSGSTSAYTLLEGR